MAIKLILSISLIISFINASVYQKQCISCHQELPVSIDKYFYRYLLKYSSETKVKAAITKYLQNPSRDKTVMADAFINRFGLKKKTKLYQEELEMAIHEYWETYKIFGKLK